MAFAPVQDYAGLELNRDPSVSANCMLGLKVCTVMSSKFMSLLSSQGVTVVSKLVEKNIHMGTNASAHYAISSRHLR